MSHVIIKILRSYPFDNTPEKWDRPSEGQGRSGERSTWRDFQWRRRRGEGGGGGGEEEEKRCKREGSCSLKGGTDLYHNTSNALNTHDEYSFRAFFRGVPGAIADCVLSFHAEQEAGSEAKHAHHAWSPTETHPYKHLRMTRKKHTLLHH